MDKKPNSSQDNEVRKGPWTMEEDLILINYIANHGEGVWNSLAQSAGLKRTGKSCRLRWLNYLRPDVRRGNITPEEELLIMELHAKWGNRWSKIAKHLPGRTDNEIKNYWRTRIQKHLKLSQSTTNSSHSSDNHEQQASSSHISNSSVASTSSTNINIMTTNNNNDHQHQHQHHPQHHPHPYFPSMSSSSCPEQTPMDATAYMMAPQSHVTETGNFWGTVDEEIWSMQLFNGD